MESLQQLKLFGYWTSHKFLPNMYLTLDSSENNQKGLGVKFRGVIACGRYFNRRINGKQVRKTFITIGYDNGRFVDTTINSFARFSDYTIISGFGHIRIIYELIFLIIEIMLVNLQSNGLTIEVEAFNLE